jgi:formylglycine-generating enzyme required for sulfatase activity
VFGVFDMSGNVAEWTSDEIPAGLMVAGGDWAGGASATRCSSASPFAAGLTSVRVGFRCCRSPTPPEQPAEPAPE